jgi:phosphate transport system ATP-binding protein
MDDHIVIDNLSVRYGQTEALKGINLRVPRRRITAVFGPANSGKTTLLRAINRLLDLTDGVARSGDVLLNDQSVYAAGTDVAALRRRVSMVFAQPSPLPMTIYDNVVYGLRLAGERRRSQLDAVVERALRLSTLWNEVRDRLQTPGLSLSGGQQQRLCLARSLAMNPEVLLLDAPTAALDPISTALIEETLFQLREHYTIVLVPHNQQQASRTGDYAAFFLGGVCVEAGSNDQIFNTPQDQRTEQYITGKFG